MQVEELRPVVVGLRRRHLPRLGHLRRHHHQPRAPRRWQTNTTANVQVANDTRRDHHLPACRSTTTRPASRSAAAASPGQNNATSYLWQYASEGNAIPFTQVFIRPQITEADIVAAGVTFAPDSGTAGVDGAARCSTARQTTPAVGRHRHQPRHLGAEHVLLREDVRPDRQHHLRGRQVPPGAARPRRPDVHPVVPRRVRQEHRRVDPDVQPGDRRAGVEGQGVARRHQAVRRRRVHQRQRRGQHRRASPRSTRPPARRSSELDRRTRQWPSGSNDVRAMDIQGGWLYLGGSFTRDRRRHRPTSSARSPSSRLARVRLSDGRPDWNWTPTVEHAPSGTSTRAQDYDRVYAVGHVHRR